MASAPARKALIFGHQPSADRSSTFLPGLEVRVLAAQLGKLLGSAAPALAGHLAARVFRLVGLPFQCRDLKSQPLARSGHVGNVPARTLQRHKLPLTSGVNVAWDGGDHAFLLDTKVAPDHQRQGIATALVGHAMRHAQAAGCEWLHVDFGPHLATFYLDACGFQSTPAGVIHLPSHGHDRILGADSVDCRW